MLQKEAKRRLLKDLKGAAAHLGALFGTLVELVEHAT